MEDAALSWAQLESARCEGGRQRRVAFIPVSSISGADLSPRSRLTNAHWLYIGWGGRGPCRGV